MYRPRTVDEFLESIRTELELVWSEGHEPSYCVFLGGNCRQIGDSLPVPERQSRQADVETRVNDDGEATNGKLPGMDKDLTDTELVILKVLAETSKPLKAIVIASKAGKTHSSYFRSQLQRLTQRGNVTSLPDHLYWLASRPLPVAL